MKLIYTTKKFRFETPDVLQGKMIEYLQFVDKQNADYTQRWCKSCGTILSEGDGPCCETPTIEWRIVHKPTYEHLRPTLYGFASYCGVGISTLHNYGQKDGFSDVIEWFKTVLQMDLEQLLLNPFNRNVGGAKFVATNNFGWKEKSEVEHTGVQGVTFINDISTSQLRDPSVTPVLEDRSTPEEWQK